ncbi:hypothetical protein BRPE64_ACDS00290 [Caballeronia insecticola]|uniref:Uncharacterized protein n=1 Tax=Caballeronia insecticola TaxID=758793 RepID=R4WEK9_9BURK|nr:hypothetical protein BRPE64_ACDS00290 [Caballeronia insecticola]
MRDLRGCSGQRDRSDDCKQNVRYRYPAIIQSAVARFIDARLRA